MSYIVCRNCKKFVEVDEKVPLNFDKCDNCGHTLEFAENDTELKMMLNNIVIPKVSYNKICASCNSLNPRETGACLHCGSTNLRLQYDLESIADNQQVAMTNSPGEQVNTRTIIIQAGPKVSPKNSFIFRIFSLLVGLIDFFFFALLGIQLVLGSSELPSEVVTFLEQSSSTIMLNQSSYSMIFQQYVLPLMAVIIISLILAGIMSVMIIPRMSYRDSLEISSTIGIAVGLITLLVTRDILTVIFSIVLCSIFSGIGGLIGEFIIHKLTNRLNH